MVYRSHAMAGDTPRHVYYHINIATHEYRHLCRYWLFTVIIVAIALPEVSYIAVNTLPLRHIALPLYIRYIIKAYYFVAIIYLLMPMSK